MTKLADKQFAMKLLTAPCHRTTHSLVLFLAAHQAGAVPMSQLLAWHLMYQQLTVVAAQPG